jgi:hypothetical protein
MPAQIFLPTPRIADQTSGYHANGDAGDGLPT